MTVTSIEQTERWLKDWVIKLDLCPFAKYPFEQGRIRIIATHATDSDTLFRFVLEELDQLYHSDAREVETTLVVVDQSLSQFNEYLDFLDLLEHVIVETGLEGQIQIASFHPDYCFEGVAEDDPSNYTNRSPYPMFHLIREASLEQAVKHYPDPEKIPERNISLLREMGLEEVRQRLKRIMQ